VCKRSDRTVLLLGTGRSWSDPLEVCWRNWSVNPYTATLWVFDPQTPNTFLHILLGNDEVMSEIVTFLTKTLTIL